MKVSILVPVFKVEKYIQKCAESLFNQSYRDLEYVFVDDCSPDQSIDFLNKVINRYPEREGDVRIIKHKKNRGLAAARNTALNSCTGECVMFVDSDDTLEKTAVEECIAKYNEGNEVVVFGMNYQYEGGRKKKRIVPLINKDLSIYLQDILFRNVAVNVCGSLIKRSLFAENNIKFIEGIDYGEDYVTFPRIISCAKSIGDLTQKYLYNYTQTNESAYTSKSLGEKQVNSIIKALEILDNFLLENKGKITNVDITQLKLRNKLFLLESCKFRTLPYVHKLYNSYDLSILDKIIHQKHLIVWRMYRSLPFPIFRYLVIFLRHLQSYFIKKIV